MSKKAKSVSRIYAVTRKGHGTLRLVKAGNWAQALRHVAKDEYTVDVAEQDQLVEAVNRGVKVELATESATLKINIDAAKVDQIIGGHIQNVLTIAHAGLGIATATTTDEAMKSSGPMLEEGELPVGSPLQRGVHLDVQRL